MILSLLAGCEADPGERLQSGRVLALAGIQGRWAGEVVPTEANCGKPTHGLMTIGRKEFGFDPFQSTTMIQGTVSEDGHLIGKLARQGGEHQNLAIEFDGALESGSSDTETIRGTLVSARCKWNVSLRRG